MAVFVLDKRKRPLMPCSEKRARQMLDRGDAVVHTLHPFTIRHKRRVGGEAQPVEVRLDPGSKSTGVAVVRKGDDGDLEDDDARKISETNRNIVFREGFDVPGW